MISRSDSAITNASDSGFICQVLLDYCIMAGDPCLFAKDM